METITLQCGQCGHTFERAAGSTVRAFTCPVCDTDVPLPRGQEESSGSRLHLLRHGTVGGHAVLCPSCRATLSPEDRNCVECGAPRLTEESGSAPKPETPTPPPKPRRRGRRKIPVFFILLAAGAAVYVWRTQFPPTPTPSVETPDPETRLAAERDRVQREWDRDRPLLERADDVEWEYRTGRVIRGRLISRNENSAAVLTEQGRETVAFEDLRPLSRAEVDRAFRDHQIEEEARRAARVP